jgi:hypothetical protein
LALGASVGSRDLLFVATSGSLVGFAESTSEPLVATNRMPLEAALVAERETINQIRN